ncbi:Fpg/Nei family DNA glycosylase [Dermatophilus congolensis]|uniref:DNA-(apurinic or apyrimidinic site) lyase n=1 Tax=Dermatophilus congolensis TaxID=1863 RepID=A0A239V7Q0_9MICO|nr:DNA-formamidopyrimidine glycosylase family protein [Dermatophilus congolensis]MBO3130440.1 Fpg/Nei family DNA glycosylase [Dermatophilus congolensis]MBO3130929.1 Fpg/Nei family DNA glycosylase [Dermatophilus congolensis]MBO3134912.1 Fpg/Nei family DNA glycosylase [Dermatophilus congolensis]MBO3137150.1 Fpg/Nei family DNA glycosylase [Dermatophilus congolensis]MBO3139394.1 Fpg/Nei family DNA glycosylase [Dermatophilus congolensis]
MPEGHVIHRMASAYDRAFAGTITRSSSPQGRFSDGAASIDGLELICAEAVGKHFFAHFGPRTIHVHLGMAGRISVHHTTDATERLGEKITLDLQTTPAFSGETDRPVLGAIRWRLENDTAWADLSGPAICEILDSDGFNKVLKRLGPDPLREDADPDRAWNLVRKSKQPIALLLMDQKIFAGVGNIFRAEALYRAGLDPMLPGLALKKSEFDDLWADLVQLMRYAVNHGQIDTVRPEHTPEAMNRPPREDPHGGEVYVYRRAEQACYICHTQVRSTVIGNRNLFWCPVCQPLSRRRPAVEARKKLREQSLLGRLAH